MENLYFRKNNITIIGKTSMCVTAANSPVTVLLLFIYFFFLLRRYRANRECVHDEGDSPGRTRVLISDENHDPRKSLTRYPTSPSINPLITNRRYCLTDIPLRH